MGNTNTIPASSTVALTGLSTSQNFFAQLDSIATRVKLDKPTPGEHQVPFITANTGGQTNPDNYQVGDSTVDNLPITVALISKALHLTQGERNSGNRPEHLLNSLALLAEADLITLINTQITAVNYGAADSSVTTANFDEPELQALITACAARPRTLLIPNAARAGVVDSLKLGADGIWRYPGIDGGIYEVSGAFADGHTVLAGPEAMIYVAEKPDMVVPLPAGEIKITEILLPTLRIPAWQTSWFDRGTRQSWHSVDLLFGIAPGRVSALSFAATP
jgi:hypothetical protein